MTMDCSHYLCHSLQAITEHRLAKESKVHLSRQKGFVQVPIAETKELYGIKFNETSDAEIFYGNVITGMGRL